MLEVASGTGQHVLHFARSFPGLDWQPSDPDPDNRQSIEAWCRDAGLPNLQPPLELEGEAGVGYRMRAGFDLPPLMFSKQEAQALVATVRIAESRLDAALARQAENALSKILAVLPLDARAAAESLALYAPLPALDPATSAHLTAMREATEARRKLQVGYLDLGGVRSERVVRPLACLFWGPVWTLAAWCELRNDFRSFRVDRVETLQVLDETFRDEPGKTLADMNRQRDAEGCA